MNSGQKQFYDYILKRVRAGNEEKAKVLLNESFTRQEAGTFNQEYLQLFEIEMLDLIQNIGNRISLLKKLNKIKRDFKKITF